MPCPAPSSASPGANRRSEVASSAFLPAMAVAAGLTETADGQVSFTTKGALNRQVVQVSPAA